MKTCLLILFLIWSTEARPEPPISSYYSPPPSSGKGYPSSTYGVPTPHPVVHKHVYVHIPPPETPEYKAPKYVPPTAPPQKHYKIIFIKAPTPPTPTVPELPPILQDEERTLIYVLVKKPEEAPEIKIPTPATTQPSKPEVYFIRYKPQKEHSDTYGPPSSYGPPTDDHGY